jgi:hypothetical protein
LPFDVGVSWDWSVVICVLLVLFAVDPAGAARH